MTPSGQMLEFDGLRVDQCLMRRRHLISILHVSSLWYFLFRQLSASFTISLISIINILLSEISACILKVYFSSTTQKTIERIDLNGGSRDVVVSEDLNSPEGLAIDWVHRRMYWTDKRFVVRAQVIVVIVHVEMVSFRDICFSFSVLDHTLQI